jgi:hypothetical protein
MSLANIAMVGKAVVRNQNAVAPEEHAQQALKMGKAAATAPLRLWENAPRLVVRVLQFVLGIVLCGIYGYRVSRTPEGTSAAEFVYAVFVAGASSVVAVLFAAGGTLSALSKRCKTYRLFAVDLVLFLLWLVAFGLFAAIFLHRGSDEPPYKESSTTLMKGAVWLDLVNTILWLVSGLYGAIKQFMGEKVDKLGNKVTSKVTSKVTGRFSSRKAAAAKEAEMSEV